MAVGVGTYFILNIRHCFCFQAFSREDLRRFEYAEDLKTYTQYGYQSELSPKIGCTQVKDFVNFFRNHVKQGN